MNIGFRADGSSVIGMGHIVRCAALASYCEKQGDSVCFYCDTARKEGVDWLKSQRFGVISLEENDLYAEAQVLVEILKSNKTDILFVDSYYLNSDYFEILHKSGIFVAAIDDDELYKYHCDVIINYGNKSNILSYADSVVVKKLLGNNYTLLRPEFISVPVAPYRETVKTILVTMGGADVNNFTSTVLKGLADIENIEILVLYGPLMQNMDDIVNIGRICQGEVKIINSPPNVAKVMTNCDLAVSAGGGTAFELFAMGVVPLFVLQAQNQMPLAHFLESKDLPLCLGYYDNVGPAMINETVKGLMRNSHMRKEIRRKIIELVPRNGCENIYDTVKALCIHRQKTTAASYV